MLVITRGQDEKVIIDDRITVIVMAVKAEKVRLGIEVPDNVSVYRGELTENRNEGVTSGGRRSLGRSPAFEGFGPSTVEELLDEVQWLSESDFDRFLTEVHAMRARRVAPIASPEESVLLERIGQGLTEEQRRRFEELRARHEDEGLNDADYQELLRLSDEVELDAARRLAALGELSILREVPLPTLAEQMGLGVSAHG